MITQFTMEKVVVIIPTYNEAELIEQTVHQVFQATASIVDRDIHILVFDSASTDGTADIVARLCTQNHKLHLKTESQKSGLGSAYLQGMRYALNTLSADIVMEFDADLSHQPIYIAPMLEQLQQADVVVGSRYVAGGGIPKNWGWHRKCLSKIGNWIARLVLTPKYKDFTSGFRATRREALSRALPEAFISNHYAYKLQLLWSLHKTHARIVEYPIVFIDRVQGYSKLPANSIVDSLKVLFLLRFYELKHYLNMCLVGLSGMVMQYFVYNVLRHGLPPFYAAQFAVMAAIVNNFTLNHHYTFRKRRLSNRLQKIKSLAVFIGYSGLMIYLQSVWLQILTEHFGEGYLKENVFMAAGILLGSVLNYIIYTQLVWRSR